MSQPPGTIDALPDAFDRLSFAFDIGRVIGPNLDDLEQPDGSCPHLGDPLPGAIETIAAVCARYGARRQYVISRVSPKRRERQELKWRQLGAWDFFRRTGFFADNVCIFLGERADKGRLAEERLVTHVVEDRLEIIAALPSHIVAVAFNPDPAELRRYAPVLAGRALIVVRDWREFAERFRLPVPL